MVRDFNINYFDCDNNEWFLALIQMTPRVKRTTATAIDLIITDSIKESIMCLSNKLLVNFLNFMFFQNFGEYNVQTSIQFGER